MKVNKVEVKLKEIMEKMNFFPAVLKNTRGIIVYNHIYDYETLHKVEEFNNLIKENFNVKGIGYARPYGGQRQVRISINPDKEN